MTIAGVASQHIARICVAVGDGRVAIERQFLPATAIAALAAEARRRDMSGEFHAAAVGHGASRDKHRDVRGDRIRWLDDATPARVEVPLFEALATLRTALNESLFLGLFSFEGHYSIYPPGSSYRRHLDRFVDDDARVLSCVLYLNGDWAMADGGMLRVHTDQGPCDVLPTGGTLVCFLADRFEHEVLPARSERLAISGWFKRRTLSR